MRRRKATLLAALAAGGTALLALGATAPGAAAATGSAAPGITQLKAAAVPGLRPLLRDVRHQHGPRRPVAAVGRPVPVARVPADRGARLVHGVLGRRHDPADRPVELRQRHRRHPGARRQRHPVVRRLHRGHHQHRHRRQLHSVPAIAQVYESLITTYNVPRIDLDVEATRWPTRPGSTAATRRSRRSRPGPRPTTGRIQFSYTLPTFPTGLPPAGLAVLQNAVADGARISTVNLLTFDYYIGTQQDMVADTESAAAGLVGQLQSLYPGDSSRQLWHMVGVTEMPGIDDFGPDETFTQADALPIAALGRPRGDRLTVLLGPAARQRRLPRHQGRRHLLRRDPADVVLQPRLRALHPLAGQHAPLSSRCR